MTLLTSNELVQRGGALGPFCDTLAKSESSLQYPAEGYPFPPRAHVCREFAPEIVFPGGNKGEQRPVLGFPRSHCLMFECEGHLH